MAQKALIGRLEAFAKVVVGWTWLKIRLEFLKVVGVDHTRGG